MTAPTEFDERDRMAMQRALELAQRGLDTTDPNPRVGCVILNDGRTVGEGWHERAGEEHAEVVALRAAGTSAQGGTAYVTLEPCSHQGRTPPCVDALVAAGVGRVVFAMLDPNPRVLGRGAERLREAGIEVACGLMAREAAELNVGFVKRMERGSPFVRLKLGMSLDGRTALASGASRWITGEAARADVQHWRARSSAILTGIGTVLADNPRLSVRAAGAEPRQPLRVVLDALLRTPPQARLFESPGVVLLFTSSHDRARRAVLEARGARVEHLADGGDGRLDLARMLARLAELEVNEVHVEAGATLAGSLVRSGLVDELLLYVAPILLGPQARALVELPPVAELAASPRYRIIESRQIETDLRLRLRPPTLGQPEDPSCSPASFRT
jgi:diaminohydroxyphosphoribosylaminopyrimidine deaminase/5-amino-6-(5-phosphoribosylamino)uracil reductase